MASCCLYSLIFTTQFKVLNNHFYKKILSERLVLKVLFPQAALVEQRSKLW